VGVLVDSNVLIDLINQGSAWAEWSEKQIRELGNREILAINPIILAEVSVTFASYEEVDAALPTAWYVRENLPWEAAYLAGRSYVQYRRRLGIKRSPMPDFYIGAHALVRGHRLLTRDPARYRGYFPNLRLITPDQI
jgi:predicted nucleic acid-binding protein